MVKTINSRWRNENCFINKIFTLFLVIFVFMVYVKTIIHLSVGD
jgi:hypothetical protein